MLYPNPLPRGHIQIKTFLRGKFVNLFNLNIVKISIGMVVQNSTRTTVVGKITDKVHPMPIFQETGFL